MLYPVFISSQIKNNHLLYFLNQIVYVCRLSLNTLFSNKLQFIMKKLIALFIGLFLICATSMQAQSLLNVDEIQVVNSAVNNVTVQLKITEQGQAVSNQIAQTKVSKKTGFTPTVNADNTLLTLNFTEQFNERELSILLEYSGIKLTGKAFGELYQLVNQK